MLDKNYHHGDLKNALIEAGIEMINETGEEQLSLRKVAARCGVSSAAPYAHFSDKEAMILAMQEHVTESFTDSLKKACEPFLKEKNYEAALLAMGRDYVLYFIKHPAYFSFLFSQPCMKAELSLHGNTKDNFKPFLMLRELIIKWCDSFTEKMSDEEIEMRILQMWATVHGVAAIAIMKNVTWDKNWEQEIQKIIK